MPPKTTYKSDPDLPLQHRMFEELLLRLKSSQEALPIDPLGFLRSVGVTPWQDVGFSPEQDKLTQVIEAVMDPAADYGNRPRFTVVESGHGVGKSLTAAALVCLWMHLYRDEAAVITLAPTFVQVNSILWRYIRGIHQDHSGKLPGQVFETPRWEVSPRCFAVGLSPRKDSLEALESLKGYHSKRLLVLLDEAPGLPRILWDAVRGLITSESNRLLALGNPLQMSGNFFEATQSENWNRIHISCLDHPNVVFNKELVGGAVSRQWVDEMVRDHCTGGAGEQGSRGAGEIEWPPNSGKYYTPSGVFQSRVLGIAPSESSDQLINLSWVMGAMGWVAEPDNSDEVAIGFDVSRVASGDMAAMILRRGPQVLWVKRRRPHSTNPGLEFAGWLKEEYQRGGATRVFVDGVGVGASVVDQARRLGLPVIDVNFGGGSGRRNFANKRAECWWRLRERLQTGSLSLPQDDLLAGDLTAPKFWHDGQGRILLEPKDQIRSRLGRSPDSGDALALSFAMDRGGDRPEGENRGKELAGGGRWAATGRRVRTEGSRWRR